MIRLHKNPQDKDWIGSGPEFYKKGSFHNKLGMWLMWIFYGIVIVQVLHAFTVIPFFPITFTILSGLGFIYYVAWRSTQEVEDGRE
jgi:FtsH-binding integral membrane protein